MNMHVWKSAAAAVLLMAGASRGSAQLKATLHIGDAAPEIKVQQWLKGSPVATFEKGKVYVVEFWATWCKPCIAGMPHLSELAREYKDKVVVSGISVMERADDNLQQKLKNFTDSMGSKMDYHVAGDAGNYMRDQWLNAVGERAIPCAIAVNQQGKIAWVGHPGKLDVVLPRIVSGEWDIAAAASRRKEQQRLAPIDGNQVVNRMNRFMGNPGKPDSALLEIATILKEEPGLKYFPKLGHFTFWTLLKTNPAEAVRYGKAWIAASEEPQWKTITDAVSSLSARNVALTKEAYVLGAESFQAQIDHYPWSMNIPATYKEIAALYEKAGNKELAAEALRKAGN